MRLRPPKFNISRRAAALTVICTLLGSLPLAAADDLAAFGARLFMDTRLSEPPGQSCSSCHDPARAFRDPQGRTLSPGADGYSLTDRNVPTLTYIGTVPTWRHGDGLLPRGGYFLDGRAPTLEQQAIEPLLNPLEMAQPDEAALVQRILENSSHRESILRHFGRAALSDPARIKDGVAAAIAAFERSATFSSFDSRYDRYLTGEYQMTREETIGLELFFSDLVNCMQCHVNETGRISPRETFTDHSYHNIGVPVNVQARQLNGLGPDHRDPGLAQNPTLEGLDRARFGGQFRVPSLRNVAVTAPYMHNGVFEDLHTAVLFYGKYTLNNRPSRLNPESGTPWRPAEIPETVAHRELSMGQPLDGKRAAYLVAFLKTLTDARFEYLIDPPPTDVATDRSPRTP